MPDLVRPDTRRPVLVSDPDLRKDNAETDEEPGEELDDAEDETAPGRAENAAGFLKSPPEPQPQRGQEPERR